ncbi:Cro/CI family transcriptional regulator [Celerinatantimonas sp. YJH-8]|uniref:Cro/CI family transcriptional regulator n=1 Tax=Celerinatantimonas sp. YJH-8 TaxID=3228714 RepID=UPI0038C3D35A
MKKIHVIQQLGSVGQVADLLGISHSAVSQWGELIPEKQALRLHMLTHGKLSYDPALYRHSQYMSDPTQSPQHPSVRIWMLN